MIKFNKDEVKRIVEEVIQKEAAQKSGPLPEHAKNTQCVIDCVNAHNLCLQTINYCLGQGGDYVRPDRFKAIVDCAEACIISARSILRESSLKHNFLLLCIQACTKAIQACEKFSGDKQMQSCRDYVNKCLESCKLISG